MVKERLTDAAARQMNGGAAHRTFAVGREAHWQAGARRGAHLEVRVAEGLVAQLGKRNRLRLPRLAGITNAIAISVSLSRIGNRRTVIREIRNAVRIRIRRAARSPAKRVIVQALDVRVQQRLAGSGQAVVRREAEIDHPALAILANHHSGIPAGYPHQ
jgi:hypothetical protein